MEGIVSVQTRQNLVEFSGNQRCSLKICLMKYRAPSGRSAAMFFSSRALIFASSDNCSTRIRIDVGLHLDLFTNITAEKKETLRGLAVNSEE